MSPIVKSMIAIGLVLCIATMAIASEDTFKTKNQFIKALGGESSVQKVEVLTRTILGMKRTIVSQPKQVCINMNFRHDSTELLDRRSHRQLTEVGRALSSRALSHIKVEITGHTDSTGSEGYNLELSQARAEKIRDYLVRHYSVAPARLIAKGSGEVEPIAANDTPQGREQNRRVVIKRVK